MIEVDEGDVVRYQPGEGQDTVTAIVTKVWSRENGCVNLCTFLSDGTTKPQTSVVHKDFGEKHGYVAWWIERTR